MSFSERAFVTQQGLKVIEEFKQSLKRIDNQKAQEMRAKGYSYVKTATRTVLFSFGDVVFSRRCYEKEGDYRYPVDEYLQLEPYSRVSTEVLFEIAQTYTKMSYRKVAETFSELKGVTITKDTVMKAVKYVGQLMAEREDYKYYRDEELIDKLQTDLLYIEGDGIQIKTPQADKETEQRTDLAHFLVHQGAIPAYGKRKQLKHKHEILAPTNKAARSQLMDYLHNHYEIGKHTVLVTNSDMGKGYTAEVFQEIAKAFGCRHEHFYDAYHLKERITREFRVVPEEKRQALQDGLFEAIKHHKKSQAKLYLDTAESWLEPGSKSDAFEKFSKKLLRNFHFTKPAHLRGFTHDGIGVMESQHCKIANRMKHQGMYWSVQGATTVANTIIAQSLGQLHDLFFGAWRTDFAYYQALPTSASDYLLPAKNTGERLLKSKFKWWKRSDF